jgi:hypothetical protein
MENSDFFFNLEIMQASIMYFQLLQNPLSVSSGCGSLSAQKMVFYSIGKVLSKSLKVNHKASNGKHKDKNDEEEDVEEGNDHDFQFEVSERNRNQNSTQSSSQSNTASRREATIDSDRFFDKKIMLSFLHHWKEILKMGMEIADDEFATILSEMIITILHLIGIRSTTNEWKTYFSVLQSIFTQMILHPRLIFPLHQ